jgi:DNA repair protein RadA/Sms
VAEAARLGFRVAVVPGEPTAPQPGLDGMRILQTPDIATALRALGLTKSGDRS